jgi:heptosyltransferase-2
VGDFVLTLPAIGLIRDNFPDAHLEILGYGHIIALAENRRYANATRSIEYGPFAAFFARNGELNPDLVAYFASFQQVISYLYDPDGFFEANLRRAGVKNFLNAYARLDDSDHAVRQLARPLQSLALYLDDPAARLFPSEDDRAAAEDFLAPMEGGPLFAIHPGSGSRKKNWPAERWQELGLRLAELKPRSRLVLVGGEADGAALESLGNAWQGRTEFLLAKDLPLPMLAAILERVAVYCGHDTGVSHIAAATGAPCVLLFGPTDPDVWAPQNAKVEIVSAPDGDLGALTVEAVIERAQAVVG